jgi:5-methylcytosine-specific restriction enzyme A
MPTKPPTFRGPGQNVWDGNERARKAAFNKRRGGRQAQGYDATWLRLRLKFLARNPFCCEPGCMRPATEVDHICSVRERPDLRLAEFNLRPFCKSHHSRRTAIEEGFARKGGRG